MTKGAILPKQPKIYKQDISLLFFETAMLPSRTLAATGVFQLSEKTHSHWVRDLILLIAVLSGLFTFMLGNRPLNVPDEARYSEIAREMLVTHDFVTPRVDGIKYFEKPPLFEWMQAGAFKVFGYSEWSARSIEAFLALLGCLGAYIAGRILYSRTTGFFAAGILATSLLYFTLARAVTLDMTVSIMLMFALLAFIIAVKYPPSIKRRLLFYGLYIFAALAVLSKGLIGIIFPGGIIFIWMLLQNRWHELKHCYLPTGIILFLAVALPWHILVQQANPEFFHYYFIKQQFTRYLTTDEGRYQPDWFYIPILLLGLFPWTGFLIGALRQIKKTDATSVYLVIWTIFILIFFSMSDSKLVPYILPCLPPLALLIAQFLSNKNSSRTDLWTGWIINGLLMLGVAIALFINLAPDDTLNFAKARCWIFIVDGILIVTAIVAILTFWCKGLRAALISFAIGTVAFLLSVCLAVPYIDMSSIKPLAMKIKPLLKPNDIVASYAYYYHDLPFYLQRYVAIINWQGELAFGSQHQDVSQLMPSAQTFWHDWQSSKTVYMITPHKTFIDIKKHHPDKFYILGETSHDILVTNHRPQK